jgi:twitching motility protein PilT
MRTIDEILELAIQNGASDLHLVAGQQPIFRVQGELHWTDGNSIEDQELRQMLYSIAPDERVHLFEETGDVDFGYENASARFRVNFFNQAHGCGAVFRVIPTKIVDADTLGVPPILKRAAMLRKGLVLITGPTGSGKTTTLAAVLDHANKNRKDHILTIEDPVEFVHQSHGCLMNHREISRHTRSFAAALRAALREDPDIIMVGELRDLETMRLAIEAALTGHLVLGTLHTVSAAKTVERIIEVFPSNEQPLVRSSLASTLRLVVAQMLIKRIDQRGRVGVFETLVSTPAVANMIREGSTHQLQSVVQTGKKHGMKLMDDAIHELLQKKIISPEDAYERATEKGRFASSLKEIPEDLYA